MIRRAGPTVAVIGVVAAVLAIPALGADPPPPTGAFRLAGPLQEARVGHTATLLPDGRVLVVGGVGTLPPRGEARKPGASRVPVDVRATAELWDPRGGAFAATGGPATARAGHAAVLLRDGRVLVVGGQGADGRPVASAEAWDPATGSFTAAGALATARGLPSVTPLPDGRVLVVGGIAGGTALATAEAWDPTLGTFAPAGQLALARTGHTATLLGDGRVLVIGGSGPAAQTGRSAEIWDPTTGAFSSAGQTASDHGFGHTATLLPDGRVALIGGYHADDADPARPGPVDVEVWDPASGAFSSAGGLSDWRYQHQAVLLQDGRVLLVGGVTPTSRTEVWDPRTGIATPAVPRTREVLGDTVTLLPDGRVLLAGGLEDGTLDTAGTWEPDTGLVQPAGVLHEARQHHTATLLPDGQVLVIGGLRRPPPTTTPPSEPDRVLASAELWAPAPTLDPVPERPAPGPSDAAPATPVAFTGTLAFGTCHTPDPPASPCVAPVIDPTVVVPFSDPRLQGPVAILGQTTDELGIGPDLWLGSFRITGPDGHWQEMVLPRLQHPDGTPSHLTSILVGQGGYDGLYAIAEVTVTDEVFAYRGWIVEGLVPGLVPDWSGMTVSETPPPEP